MRTIKVAVKDETYANSCLADNGITIDLIGRTRINDDVILTMKMEDYDEWTNLFADIDPFWKVLN